MIVTAGAVTYWNSLGSPFIWDDRLAIVTNPTIRHFPAWDVVRPPRDTPVAGRPLLNLSFAVNYAFGGLKETGYHVVNIAIHIACALLLFGIVRRTIMKSRSRGAVQDARARNASSPIILAPDIIALVTALLWMLHPLQSEAVNYTTQRSESLMAAFFLLTLYSTIRAPEVTDVVGTDTNYRTHVGSIVSHSRAPKAGVRPSRRRREDADPKPVIPVKSWHALAVIACACGMLTKESMVVAPLIVVLYDWAFRSGSLRATIGARRGLYLGLASTWVVFAGLLSSAPHSAVGASETIGAWTYLLNQVEVIGRYLRLSVWPSALVLDYGLPRPLALRDVLPGALLLIGLVAAGGAALRRSRRIGFLVIWFFLTLAPTSSVIPISMEVGADRRMYLPFAAVATLVVLGGWTLLDRSAAANVRLANARRTPSSPSPGRAADGHLALCARVTAAGLTVAILLALAAQTIARNAEYQNPLTLWRADVDRRPHGRSRMVLAGELVGAGQHAQAVALFREAIADFPDARVPLGAELILQQRQFEDGIAVLQQFLADRPSPPKRRAAHSLLAQAFASEGKLDEAADQWRAVLRDAPGDATATANLAQILSAQAHSGSQQGDAAHMPPSPQQRSPLSTQ